MARRIFGAIFAVVGVVAFAQNWQALKEARRSAQWPPVEAVVLSSHVGSSSARHNTGWFPLIEFEYQFQGKTYRSDQVYFSRTEFSHQQQAEEIVARNPVGAHVKAYVDPDQPQRAVLEKGLAGPAQGYSGGFVLGPAFLVAGLVVLFYPSRSSTPRR